MGLFHRLMLKSHGLTDEQIDAAEKAGLNWSGILALLLQYGLPALIAFLQSLIKPPVAAALLLLTLLCGFASAQYPTPAVAAPAVATSPSAGACACGNGCQCDDAGGCLCIQAAATQPVAAAGACAASGSSSYAGRGSVRFGGQPVRTGAHAAAAIVTAPVRFLFGRRAHCQ